jgi:hypothetical protein
MVTRIRQEGFRNSRVMDTARALTDGIGARLTGSPNLKKAAEWARKQLESWGLSNAQVESWGPFGRGWAYESVSVRIVAPDVAQLLALPEAWTPGTEGAVRAKVRSVEVQTKEDLEKHRGKLAGNIVLLVERSAFRRHETPEPERYDEKALADLFAYELPGAPRYPREEIRKARELRRAAQEFFAREKAAAVFRKSWREGGTVAAQGSRAWLKDEPAGVPTVVLAAEHFGRIARLIENGSEVEAEVEVRARFLDQDPMGYNAIAEIPGTDRKGELVVLGAHLDSWHGGTGATDNAAGVAAAMEAVRILQALGVRPRRTIRIGLWGGEEQGLLGSRAHVARRFATRGEPKDPEQRALPDYLRTEEVAVTAKSDHAKFSAYFNLDNGTGKIRGIYAQENAAARPIFEAWLEPFRDLGATTVTMRNTGGTDHEAFDEVGLPGFQFIQDQIEYGTLTHHSNMDLFERL